MRSVADFVSVGDVNELLWHVLSVRQLRKREWLRCDGQCQGKGRGGLQVILHEIGVTSRLASPISECPKHGHASQHRRRRRPHQRPDSDRSEHQKKHPLHRKTPKKPPFRVELISEPSLV